ncbi:hypothetical protein EDI_185560 [Entamoeba dispar SAW760]|uniref:Uncharacterized protein n=1 Tax=Entamoeba dispar (strain ATCC PRA-260 / SAW760) TaxID=370354 RepID=B0EVE7_ENTDS|nr:uncharacterized protein EDI_185560 [Entamoeba dispar SAW760]EDR21497.1 hypothetical protein EDI_185560 [Entamoeba dispar SAW760]|eukprot:EDR21497.1 hypothetical protein EDI_185560 [Entamoeba dispar SAW760]
MYLLAISLIIIIVNGKNNFFSVCMSDFVAVNIDAPTNIETIRRTLCYDKIPDYKTNVHGYNIKSYCFVDENDLYVKKGNRNISRCGEWLQLVGPSQKPIVCMVAGSERLNISGVADESEYSFIGVPRNIFLTLTGGFDETSNVVTQITLSETNFDLRINPTLYLINRNETTATIQFTDFNRNPEKISINNIFYDMTPQNTFEIPLFENDIIVHLITFDNEKIDFPKVNLKKGNKYTSIGRFVNYDMTECNYMADKNVFFRDSRENHGTLLTWQILQWNQDKTVVKFDNCDQEIKFIGKTSNLSMVFMYPTAIMLNQDFSYFEVEFETSSLDYKFVAANTGRCKDVLKYTFDYCSPTQVNLPIKYYFNKAEKIIKMRMSLFGINKRFSNIIELIHMVPQGTILNLISAQLVRETRMLNQTECSSVSFNCLGTECTITNQLSHKVPFNFSCLPSCGVCRVGFTCNDYGKCVEEVNLNQRSEANVISCLIILLLLQLLL